MNRTLLTTVFLMVWGTFLFAGIEKSDQLVEQAWKAYGGHDLQMVEQKFMAAIDEDKNNARAYLGLSYFYHLKSDYEKSWTAFNKALKIERNPYPYVFSTWLTPKFKTNFDKKDMGVIELLEKLSVKADSINILKAMANEVLGEFFQEKGDFAKSKKYFQQINSIDDWTMIGPFDNISAAGFDKVYPPEVEFDLSKTYEGKDGVPARWFPITAMRNDKWLDFRRYFAYFQSVFYANNFVYSPEKQTVQIRIGTSGSLKAFLNDELIVQYFDENNNDLDTYIVETELQAGWNRLLIKCGFSEIESCNFLCRITDLNGDAIEGLKISTENQAYTHHPGAPANFIENFAENFFKNRIQANPTHLENYLLLADCYLRNDKAIEAELVLRDAIQLSPNCIILYYHILEAYQRGEKDDEYETTVEKVYSLNKNIPGILEYKISSYLENEEIEKAEELLKKLEKIKPESEMVYQLYLWLYGSKEQAEKLIELSNRAFQKYPDKFEFASIEALITIQKTQQYDQAIKIMKQHLDKKLTTIGLITLANIYLKSSNIQQWEQTFQKAIEIDPAATGFYNQMTNVYVSLQNYDKAEQTIKKAIEICPNASIYWSKLGEIHRIKNQIEKSKHAYRIALEYNPTDYDSRDVLRELEGKKSIFSLFASANIDSLIQNSPDAESYPDDGAVIILDDAKRAVYEKGASEFSEEILVKVFNNSGVEDFQEYWIDFNSYTQTLIVEKAVVIKKDGSEIKADIDVNHVVFKSLEPNDHIHLKWRIKNYYKGKLSRHFWDNFHFNCFYPITMVRYALLVPENSILHNTQNMPDEPTKKRIDYGVMYQWTLHNEPAIDFEVGMPALVDVGKILYISSIKEWECIVEWYADLAQTKARNCFEIEELVDNLFKGKDNSSEKEKIETVYNYITENIRYSYVPFRQSGLIPQKARSVLVNKIGDCKDMSTLCIAMLNQIGIQAYYVLVNTTDEGRNSNVTPSIAFNHCMVGVETENGLLYLDPTAYNFPMGSLPKLDVEAFSLLIKPGIKAPGYLRDNNLISNNVSRYSTVKIQNDNSISVQEKSTKSGILGASMRYYYREVSQKDKETEFSERMTNKLPNFSLRKFEIEGLENLEPAVQYHYDYKVSNYVTEVNQFKFLKIPWTDALDSDAALSYDQRQYPYNYLPWADTLTHEIEIHLPENYQPVELLGEVKLSSPIADYHLNLTCSDDKITGTRQLIYKKDMISPDEYCEFKKFYNDVIKEDTRQILLQKEKVKVNVNVTEKSSSN